MKKMRAITLIIFLLLASHSFAQKEPGFIADFLLGDELQEGNSISNFCRYDFSSLWTTTKNQFVYGVIGRSHQRLSVKLMSVERNPFDSLEYIVSGKSMVKETICEFIGVIRLIEIREVKELHSGVDNEYDNSEVLKQGVLVAEYEFRENKTQDHSGFFKGNLYSKWYLDSNGDVKYDDIQLMADGYSNNAFVGTWESYVSGKVKICNWGDYRVPQANEDFDIGVGEFSVSEQYWNNGWADIRSKRKTNEEEKWWDN